MLSYDTLALAAVMLLLAAQGRGRLLPLLAFLLPLLQLAAGSAGLPGPALVPVLIAVHLFRQLGRNQDGSQGNRHRMSPSPIMIGAVQAIPAARPKRKPSIPRAWTTRPRMNSPATIPSHSWVPRVASISATRISTTGAYSATVELRAHPRDQPHVAAVADRDLLGFAQLRDSP